MNKSLIAAVMAIAAVLYVPGAAFADNSKEINHDVYKGLKHLYETHPSAKILSQNAKGILIFPSIGKAGFIVSGAYGEGALLEKGVITRYYSSFAASVGLLAGVQKYGYALFFMTDKSLAYLKKSKGWSLGTGPSIVVVDKGFEKSLSTTTAQDGIFAFFFSSKGLMGGIGVEGTKITRIHPDEQ